MPRQNSVLVSVSTVLLKQMEWCTFSQKCWICVYLVFLNAHLNPFLTGTKLDEMKWGSTHMQASVKSSFILNWTSLTPAELWQFTQIQALFRRVWVAEMLCPCNSSGRQWELGLLCISAGEKSQRPFCYHLAHVLRKCRIKIPVSAFSAILCRLLTYIRSKHSNNHIGPFSKEPLFFFLT